MLCGHDHWFHLSLISNNNSDVVTESGGKTVLFLVGEWCFLLSDISAHFGKAYIAD